MSWQAIRYVFELPALAPNGEPITSTEVAVMAALANRLNSKTIQCNPTIATISKESKASENTVHRVIKNLQTKGILEVKRRSVPGKGLRANFYVFNGFDPAKYETPQDDGGVPSRKTGVPFQVVGGVPLETERGAISRRKNQKVNQNEFNHSLTNVSEEGDAIAPPARIKKSSVKSSTELAAGSDAARVIAHIAETSGLTNGQRAQYAGQIKRLLADHTAEDIIGWWDASTKRNQQKHIPWSWATNGIPNWIDAGRPAVERGPNHGGKGHGVRGSDLVAQNEAREAARLAGMQRDLEFVKGYDLPLRAVS